MDSYIGLQLDQRYEILEVLGVGGMATVYKAYCKMLNRFVAIKILQEAYQKDPVILKKFYMESQAVAKLSHPNIIAVYDVSHTDAFPYIVMELVDGITLKQYLSEKGHLSWQEACFFAKQMTQALEHAHSRGVIHQDIKPQNILITKEGQAKLTDFGIASFTTDQDTRMIQEAIGSVHYISPEQAKGSTVDARTDIYSLGVVMYEMLTGKLPFEGDTALSIVMQHMNAVPLLPSELVAGIPSGLDEIVMRAMCPTVSMRYPSATGLEQDLTRLEQDTGVQFGYSSAHLRSQEPPMDATQVLPNYIENTHPKTKESPAVQSEKPPKRFSPKSFVVAGVLLFVLVLGFVSVRLLTITTDVAESITVPNLVGMDYSKDIQGHPSYQDFHFTVVEQVDTRYADGTVIEQSPLAGDRIKRGEAITLVICRNQATQSEQVMVPALVGKSKEDAERLLRATLPNVLYRMEEKPSDEVQAGMVLETMPAAGESLEENQILMITISTGPATQSTSQMPNVVGKTIEEAKKILEEYDIKVQKQSKVASQQPKGTVIGQSIPAGQEVEAGQGVALEISSGIADETQTGGTGSKPIEPKEVNTRTITVSIPEADRSSAHIVVQFDDGEVAFEKTVSGVESLEVPLKGTGTRYITVLINQVPVGSQEVKFSE